MSICLFTNDYKIEYIVHRKYCRIFFAFHLYVKNYNKVGYCFLFEAQIVSVCLAKFECTILS